MSHRTRAVRAQNLKGGSQRAPIKNYKLTAVAVFAGLGALCMPAVHAQEDTTIRLEELVVTAQKRGTAENLQDVPLAITAFNSDIIEKRQVRNVNDLSYSVPNVAIDSSGTVKGLANFSIRGLGVTSSVPSLDPTVGTFVDGVYIGSNYGVILDTFDLEGIEILRGPQGLLFGRNVTGGAVLVNTRDPSHEYSAKLKAGVETGLQTTIAGSVTGSLVEDTLSGKLVALYKDDEGYFTNAFNGNRDFGGDETFVVRGALGYTPTESTEFVLKVEAGNLEGDGPSNQNAEFLAGEHDVNIDNEGFTDLSWQSLILESNFQVGFGDGTVTSILGYRQVDSFNDADIDSRPQSVFNGIFNLDQEQFSAETRYTGSFYDGKWTATAGFYYFTQDLLYREFRDIFDGVVVGTLGGDQNTETFGAFTSNDILLNDSLVLTLGARFTHEEKDAQVATFSTALPCPIDTSGSCVTNFEDEEDWTNVSPKVALQWQLNDDAQVYASWQQGFRSGGYNLRVTNPTQSAGPVDEEEQTAIELGFKGDWLGGRLRTNLALFTSEIEGLQRTITMGDPNNPTGVIQVADNTADATIEGLEFEFSTYLSDSLLLSGFLGLLDSEYDVILNDLTGDGVIDDADFALRLPLLAETTYGLSLNYTHELARGKLDVLASYSFRDDAESTDNNQPGTVQEERDIVNASINFTSANEKWTAALYGKNLTDEVILQTLAIFPGITTGPLGTGTIQPVAKGRLFGFEVTYNF